MATFIPNVTDVFPEPALYTPDFSFMDKMLSRRQAQYDQGWAKVNAAYNFVNRDLTNPTNIKERDVFLKQAKLNLRNLSATDLSQFQNVKSANNVFQPWVSNERALGDAALTSHWKTEEETGNGYRLQDGGKYFNQANIDYVKKQRAAFAQDNAESWKEYYSNKRSYTPYYDYHKEVSELMKDFKPSTYEIDRVSGLYKYTDKNASWTQAEIRKYLDANLSDKAKQQMKIEGDVMYNNNPQQMGQVYLQSAKAEIATYDAGIEWANKQLKSTSNKDEVTKINNYISGLEDRKKSLNLNIDSINKGDFTFVKKKGEELSYGIFYNNYLQRVSNGFSHEDVSHKINGDDVALTVYRENMADRRQEAGFRHAEKMAMLKGEIAPPAQMNTLTLKEGDSTTLKTFYEKADIIDAETGQLQQVNKGMVATWMSSLPQNRGKEISTADVTENDIKAFIETGDNGKRLSASHSFWDNQKKIELNESKKEEVLNQVKRIEKTILDGYSNEERQQIQKSLDTIKNIGKIKLDDGTTVTSQELADGMKSGKVKISANSLLGFDLYGNDYEVVINGKTHRAVNKIVGKGENQFIENQPLLSAVKQIMTAQGSKAFSKFEDDVNDYFERHGKELTYTANLQTFSKGSYEAKTLEAEMTNIFPEAKFSIQHAGIGADARGQGSSYFYVDGKGDFEPSDTQIMKYLEQRGYKGEVIDTQGTGVRLVKVDNMKSPIINQYTRFNEMERTVLQNASMDQYIGTGGRYMSRPYSTSYSDRKLMLKKEHNSYYLLVQGLTGGNNYDQYPDAFTDPSSAILLGQYLTAPSPDGKIPEAQLQWYIQNNSRK